MNIFVALVNEIPRRNRDGHPVIFRDFLPNGIAYIAAHPSNLESVINFAREKSVETRTKISVVVIDLQEILNSDFVSPDSVEGLPDHYSVN